MLALTLALAGATTSAAADAACRPLETAEPVHTEVILVGHAAAPPELHLPALEAVDDDIFAMRQFFSVVRPAVTSVHLDRTTFERSRNPEIDFRDATLPALRRTIAEVRQRVAAHSGPSQVYFYYSGHGQSLPRGGLHHTRLFLRPTGTPDDPTGPAGAMDADILAREVLAPLSEVADLHLVIDACQSFYALEVRGVAQRLRIPKTPPSTNPGMVDAFRARFPRVGALLATNGHQVAFERPDLGGLFSYALRSAGLGLADWNADGIITYAEMQGTVEQVLDGMSSPGVVAPGRVDPGLGAGSPPFLDLRRAQPAVICFTGADSARYEVLDERGRPFGVLHFESPTGLRMFLPPDTNYLAVRRAQPGDPGEWFEVRGVTGAFRDQAVPVGPQLGRGARFPGELAPQPIVAHVPEPRRLAPRLEPTYLGLGAHGAARAFPGGGPGEVGATAGAGLDLRLGRGAAQGLLTLDWTTGAGRIGAQSVGYRLDTVDASGAALWLPAPAVVEWSLGPQLGASAVRQGLNNGLVTWAAAFSGGLRTEMLLPVPGLEALAVRLFGQGGAYALCADGCGTLLWSPFVGGGLGADWEQGL